MFNTEINFIAVISAAVVSLIFGFIWYGPLFGKQWQMLMDEDGRNLEKIKERGMARIYMVHFLTQLLARFVLAHIIIYVDAYTVGTGILAGIWIWLGFVVTTSVNSYMISPKPKSVLLLIIDIGYQFFSIIIMSGMIASW